MTITINDILKASFIGLTCLVLSACGGNKKPAAEAEIANTSDITRPPAVVKGRLPVEAESDPDETISYDEWKRKRDEADNGEKP